MPALPTPFGKYELVDKVASGGMAEVFRACTRGEAGFEKFLAIKRILPHLSRDTEFVVMLIDEAKIAVSLNHANVVQVYDLGKVDGIYFIAMEFVEGADLKAVLLKALQGGAPIPPALAVFLIMEVLKGLEYAHQKKVVSKDTQFALQIIHRDISPPNILLSYEGEVKIVDFGIAKANTRMMETAAGVLKGKFEYMSPEQAAGLELDQRTDLFSAGLCLFEAMTGVNPFSASADLQVIQKVRAARFPPASSINPNIPPRLDRVINKALAREKEDRYSNASEFRNDLAHAAYESGLIATSPKLAAFMRELFKDEIAKGQHFVSGNSFPDPRENRNNKGPDTPYHRPPSQQSRSKAPRDAASPWEGRENRTVLRMKVDPDTPPAKAAPKGRAAQTKGARASQGLTRPDTPQAQGDFDAAATFLAPPSQRPRRPSPNQGPQDLSAERTFLAPSQAPSKRPGRSRGVQSLMHPDGPQAKAPQESSRPQGSTAPQRRSAAPPKERRPRNPAVDSTFLPPALSHNAPPPTLRDDGTDALETKREALQVGPQEPRRVKNRDAAGRALPTSQAQGPDLREGPPAQPTITAYVPPPQAPQPAMASPHHPPSFEGEQPQFEPELPPSFGTIQSPVHPNIPGGEPHYETTAPPPAQGASPSQGGSFRRWGALLFAGGLLIGTLVGGALGTILAGGETEPLEPDAQAEVSEIMITAQDGATTTIDGQNHGSEYPLRLALSPGDVHSVEIALEGFEPLQQDVTLEAGQVFFFHARFGAEPTSNDMAD